MRIVSLPPPGSFFNEKMLGIGRATRARSVVGRAGFRQAARLSNAALTWAISLRFLPQPSLALEPPPACLP